MTSGQTALSLTDLPFMFSLVNLLYILTFGLEITTNGETVFDINRYYTVGLIAVMLGTFFVFWHPIQWIIDKVTLKWQDKFSTYLITNLNHVPPEYNIIINEFFRLSLNTSAIKYLKDKMTGQIYFVIILTVFLIALFNLDFQKTFGLTNSTYLLYIQLGIGSMLGGTIYFSTKQIRGFRLNLQLTSLYFLLSNKMLGYSERTNLIKQAIDLNDWDTARQITNKTLRDHWKNLPHHSTKNSSSVSGGGTHPNNL